MRAQRGLVEQTKSGYVISSIPFGFEQSALNRMKLVKFTDALSINGYRSTGDFFVDENMVAAIRQVGINPKLVSIARSLRKISKLVVGLESTNAQLGSIAARLGSVMPSFAVSRGNAPLKADEFDDHFGVAILAVLGIADEIESQIASTGSATAESVVFEAQNANRQVLVSNAEHSELRGRVVCPATMHQIASITEALLEDSDDAIDFDPLPISASEVSALDKYALTAGDLYRRCANVAKIACVLDPEELLEAYAEVVIDATKDYESCLGIELREPTTQEVADDPLFAFMVGSALKYSPLSQGDAFLAKWPSQGTFGHNILRRSLFR